MNKNKINRAKVRLNELMPKYIDVCKKLDELEHTDDYIGIDKDIRKYSSKKVNLYSAICGLYQCIGETCPTMITEKIYGG